MDLLVAERGAVSIIAGSMNEENVARFLTLPFAMIGSDGAPRSGKPHPRVYGTFPRVIRRFVRELKSLTLEEAVRKMTSASAARLGLRDRGRVQVGQQGDAVLFDPAIFSDTATFEDPVPASGGAFGGDGGRAAGCPWRPDDRRAAGPVPPTDLTNFPSMCFCRCAGYLTLG